MKWGVWRLRGAKNKFSEIVEHVLKDGAQIIARHGVETVVVISFQEYRPMLPHQPKLSDFFRRSPLKGIELDLGRLTN